MASARNQNRRRRRSPILSGRFKPLARTSHSCRPLNISACALDLVCYRDARRRTKISPPAALVYTRARAYGRIFPHALRSLFFPFSSRKLKY